MTEEKQPQKTEEKKVVETQIKGVKITYFVHGTTTDNEQSIATGWNQGELSELGKKQSIELKEKIDINTFDIVFCSDLKRAIDSAKLTFDNKKIIQDKRLREANYGDFNGEKESKFKPNLINYISNKFPNGESYKDVENRIIEFLNELLNNYQSKNIAIVAHQAPQLALDVLLKGKTWEQSIKEDWRNKKAWQPGWDYKLTQNLSQKTTQEPTQEKPKETPKKKPEPKKPIIKKEEALARGQNLHVSKKQCVYICKFIMGKPIDKAISELELVIKLKKPIPFKGEIPHRKGKIMSGRYPIKAAKLFIKLLQGLKGNIIVNNLELEKTKISAASASWAARPMRSNSRQGKRTNVILTARETGGNK